MRLIQIAVTIFLLSQVNQLVLAADNLEGIDAARAFPVQRNNTVIHNSPKNDGDVNQNSTVAATATSAPDNKPAPKDTTLNINGNGGSTNRSAGGTATLRKRFTFD
jgi:hypothetical protein